MFVAYSDQSPPLTDFCSKYFRFGDLIECGDTWSRYRVSNLPLQPATYSAMRELCSRVLDTLVDQYGSIELHYAFASPELDRLVRLKPFPRTTRHLDQHAGCELNRNGKPYCQRLGLAVDFRVAGVSSFDVAHWTVRNTGFDRLYFYGSERPIHVSVGPDNSRLTWRLPAKPSGSFHEIRCQEPK